MEERIIDKDEGRKIKIKRTAEGAVDAVEEGVGNGEAAEDEVVFDLPEDEYDEDLVGLTPSQLEKALEERAKAEAERDKMLAAAEDALSARDYEKAETFFTQALVYDADCVRAKQGIWTARTKDFEDLSVFRRKKSVREIAEEDAGVKEFIRSRVGGRLSADREEYRKEEEPLSLRVEAAQAERRAAFAENRKYYLIRFAIFLTIGVLFAVATAVAVPYIWRTQNSVIPIALSAAFGALCLIAVIITLVFSHKLYVACRLCSANEKLTSTEDGKRLAFLREQIGLLDLILNDD